MFARALRLVFSLLLSLAVVSPGVAAPSDADLLAMLQTLDDRQQNNGDYKALVYIEQKEKDKELLVYEAVVYRRDEDDKLMLLFTRPRSEAGKGYLRLDKNLFMYDPSVGRWDRRTERERILGTDSRRADFDESRLAVEFTPTFVAHEKLGRYKVWHISLKAKKDADVPYPIVHLWIDAASGNILKRQDRALSDRLMRTSYYPRWKQVHSESKGAPVWIPDEIRIYDEVEKGNQTLIVLRKVDLKPLPRNTFTKAWVESKSR